VICLRVAGKLFHRRGPATVKLLSRKVVHVRGTVSDRYLFCVEWDVNLNSINYCTTATTIAITATATTTTTIIQDNLHKLAPSTKNWRILLEQSFTACMVTSTSGLGRRRWSFP